MIKKTVIITGYECNNNCLFCIDADKRAIPGKSTTELIAEISDAYKRGRRYLEIIGGEQTIRPDFLNLIKSAKKIGFKTILMATNGRMLAYETFAKQAIEAGITSVIFSIHGHNSKLHDSLTQARGSFNELMQGIKIVKSLGLRNIGSNTTIVRQNYKKLPEIGEFIYGLGIRNAEFIFVDPTYGAACKNFKKVVPRISEAAPFIRKCLNIGRNKHASHWHIRYVPLCYFIGYENQVSELAEKKSFHTEHLAPDFKNYNVSKSRAEYSRIKTEKCAHCIYFGRCEGIWKEYIKNYGDSELMAVLNKDKDAKESAAVNIEINRIDPYTRYHKQKGGSFFIENDFEATKAHFKGIAEFKRKILLNKQIPPITIQKNKDGKYKLIDGHTRYFAFKQLKLKSIKCIVI